MVNKTNEPIKENVKTEFENRREEFHEKHPEPWEIYNIKGVFNLFRSTNCDTRFLLVLISRDTIDSHETVTDMLLARKSLESRFGASNVYWREGVDALIRIYVFFDFEELCSRLDNRTFRN